MKLLLIFGLFGLSIAASGSNVFHTKLYQDEKLECVILSEGLAKYRGFSPEEISTQKAVHITYSPAIRGDSVVKNNDQIIEIFAQDQSLIDVIVDSYCEKVSRIQPLKREQTANIEIEKIVDGGDQFNRIDVVFMGDGYLQSERDNFFDDMIRLTQDMFSGDTFQSYLPVFNIWAIFVPSQVSGIGYDGPINTAFRLYRSQGQLRGIFTGNAQYARQVCAMTNASGCDYPSLIGNDDFYGGLGGEFVISTKSNRTGTVVLRHEMGHNFVNVGEEYDNGQVYRGVNSATTVNGLGWSHWLSGERREERMMWRVLEYPWRDLTTGQWTHTFSSDGAYSRYYISVSVSAAGEEDCLEFMLDGQVLPWTSSGFDDREFYDWKSEVGFTSGSHTFSVRSKTPSSHPQIDRMICSVNIHEYGNEQEFHEDSSYVSAYPTWDVSRRKTFRPTNRGCLMKDMLVRTFCTICQEGMWYEFLRRISLIDGVDVSPPENGVRTATIRTLKLGQKREDFTIPGEHLEINWFHDGIDQPQFQDEFEIQAQPGPWRATVRFVTPEIRNDPQGLTFDQITFTVLP